MVLIGLVIADKTFGGKFEINEEGINFNRDLKNLGSEYTNYNQEFDPRLSKYLSEAGEHIQLPQLKNLWPQNKTFNFKELKLQKLKEIETRSKAPSNMLSDIIKEENDFSRFENIGVNPKNAEIQSMKQFRINNSREAEIEKMAESSYKFCTNYRDITTEFAIAAVLCHECLAEKKKGSKIKYQGSSPDEVAILEGISKLNCLFLGTEMQISKVDFLGEEMNIQVEIVFFI